MKRDGKIEIYGISIYMYLNIVYRNIRWEMMKRDDMMNDAIWWYIQYRYIYQIIKYNIEIEYIQSIETLIATWNIWILKVDFQYLEISWNRIKSISKTHLLLIDIEILEYSSWIYHGKISSRNWIF